ncbi:MAG: hypothetical protein QOD09_851 [Bradyrhizobium sp.]|jgi:hypothetical protein|nr:hypothetical protein [Bradyrhizobium sp.]
MNREAAGTRRRPIAIAATGIATAAILVTALAATHSRAAGPEAALSPQATGYLPSISDLMIATIQPRHERLWRAGQDGNWEFAAYELGNLHGAFGRIGQAHPTTQNVSFPEMVTSVTEQPFKELKSAVQSKDASAFTKGYADLTDACNSCHQALNHGVVEIVVPSAMSPSDLKIDSVARN